MGMISGAIKTGIVVLAIGGGVAVLGSYVLGEERIEDLFTTAKGNLNDHVDEMIDERHVLEARVAEVRESYPKEIASLRREIKEAENAHAEAEDEMKACTTVVAIAKEDIAGLNAALADADGVHRFQGRIYRDSEIEGLLTNSLKVAEDYRLRHNRLADESDLLKEQITLMKEELTTMKAEWQAFETDYRMVQRNLDQIERNERIIEMTKRRTHSRESARKKHALPLNQVRERVEEMRMAQEEELRVLRRKGPEANYEARARMRLAAASAKDQEAAIKSAQE